MKKKHGQNSLLVVAIRCEELEYHVDTKLHLHTGRVGRVKAFKFLLSKYFYQNTEWSQDDLIALNLLYSEILDKVRLGMLVLPTRTKFYLSDLVKLINQGNQEWSRWKRIFSHLHHFRFVNPNGYFGALNDLTHSTLHLCYERRVKRNYPAKYIGVGYKDKGGAKFSFQDGSPSWQNVASVDNRLRVDNISIHSELDTVVEEDVILSATVPDGPTYKRHLTKVRIPSSGKIAYKAQKGSELHLEVEVVELSYDSGLTRIMERYGLFLYRGVDQHLLLIPGRVS